jgi:hypothetical protein
MSSCGEAIITAPDSRRFPSRNGEAEESERAGERKEFG